MMYTSMFHKNPYPFPLISHSPYSLLFTHFPPPPPQFPFIAWLSSPHPPIIILSLLSPFTNNMSGWPSRGSAAGPTWARGRFWREASAVRTSGSLMRNATKGGLTWPLAWLSWV